jgi:hypothetical protein
VSEWAPRDEGGFTRVEPALARIYGQGRRRHRRASRRRSDRALAMHRWRKRVKDLRYATEALSRSDPGLEGRAAIAAVRALAPTRKRSSERTGDLMPKLARRADALGEMLGEEHELFLLAERVREGGTGCGRRTRRALLKLIERRRTRLTRRALQDGARLYGRPPKKLLRRVRRAYAREARM